MTNEEPEENYKYPYNYGFTLYDSNAGCITLAIVLLAIIACLIYKFAF